jgi:type I restriction enzyme M protein
MQDESSSRLVQELWNYCTVLRDDGLSCQDYLEQLTTLLFVKMAEERSEITGGQPIPKGYRWADLSAPQMEGVKLEEHYRETLRVLGQKGGMLGLIFRKAHPDAVVPASGNIVAKIVSKRLSLGNESSARRMLKPYKEKKRFYLDEIEPRTRKRGKDAP